MSHLPCRDLENKFSAAGIRHGDIRPPNVLRGPDGGLRLIDFGFSTLFDSTLIVGEQLE
jgi:serine/threonine protein kinase